MLAIALLLAQAATAAPTPPKLSPAQSDAIMQALQELNLANEIVEALRRVDAARKALAARVAEAAQTCGAQPVRSVNGAIVCPDAKGK